MGMDNVKIAINNGNDSEGAFPYFWQDQEKYTSTIQFHNSAWITT